MTNKAITTSPLMDAIRAGSLTDVLRALDAGADVEEIDMHGRRGLPLRTACFQGNPEIVRELLIRGADPNVAADDGPGAPIRLARRRGHIEVLDLLFQHGARDFAAAPLMDAPPLDATTASAAETQPAPKPAAAHHDNVIEYEAVDFDFSDFKEKDVGTESTVIPIHADATTEFGTETRLLSMDLIFLDETMAGESQIGTTSHSPTAPIKK